MRIARQVLVLFFMTWMAGVGQAEEILPYQVGITMSDPDPNTPGVLIKEIVSDSPASRSGLSPGDEILEVQQERVFEFKDVKRAINSHGWKWGTTTPVRLLVRSGQQIKFVTTRLRYYPEFDKRLNTLAENMQQIAAQVNQPSGARRLISHQLRGIGSSHRHGFSYTEIAGLTIADRETMAWRITELLAKQLTKSQKKTVSVPQTTASQAPMSQATTSQLATPHRKTEDDSFNRDLAKAAVIGGTSATVAYVWTMFGGEILCGLGFAPACACVGPQC